MKFAKELEDDLVPEWRAKYLNYKQGKKKIKAVAKALRAVNQSPKFGSRTRLPGVTTPTSGRLPFTSYDFTKRRTAPSDTEPLRNAASIGQSSRPNTKRGYSTSQLPDVEESNSLDGPIDGPATAPAPSRPSVLHHLSETIFTRSPPIRIPEAEPLAADDYDDSTRFRVKRYGSIIGTPPKEETLAKGLPSLELPGPAIRPDKNGQSGFAEWDFAGPHESSSAPVPTHSPDAYHVGATHIPHKKGFSLPRRLFKTGRTISHPHPRSYTASPMTKRQFSASPTHSPGSMDVNLSLYRELDAKQDEFFAFLDKELEKVESFYKLKENDATHRLQVLRDQLHEMRDRRMVEIAAMKNKKIENPKAAVEDLLHKDGNKSNGDSLHVNFLKPLEGTILRKSHVGKTSKAMGKLASPSAPRPDDQKDYVRRSVANEHVPYKAAKRKLKLALQEFYRGLELLKSYAMLNRTGFRKINKKYDKATNARPVLRYMSEKVNKSHFVQSDIIEGHIVAVEDLYARYFERGNHKVAVSKLRSGGKRHGDFSQSAFRNGLFVAAGLVFGIQGLVYCAGHLFSDDPVHSVRTSYLLQLYGGYFLSLILFILFTFACRIWTVSKVNYAFVFEYDNRHTLDWRQLAEIPSFFLFLNGLFLWLNFRQSSSDPMFIYWPVILIGVSLIIMAFPAPILYHHARKWWAFSNWRLLLAGIYPVEFRDFFLGDMYCSETYSMGNIELFFCLYAQDWSQPDKCNSSHSRLLGFFSTLPAVWRALQCLRRYYDSGNWFPHLANFGKYLGNILYYMSLSMYRVHQVTELRALFILFATINSLYCSFWDVFMDWSLGNPYSPHPFLRPVLGYRHIWPYYLAMILDPIIRFQWVFYAIYAKDLQHSAILSFFVALAEVLRRAMWMLFRVENEHCNNVGHFRASRDIPLPYTMPDSPRESQEVIIHPQSEEVAPTSTAVDLERSPDTTASSLRMRKTRSSEPPTPMVNAMKRMGTVIITAHAQDYQKKKREGVLGQSPASNSGFKPHDSSEDEEEEEDDSSEGHNSTDAEDLMELQKTLSKGRD